MFPKLSPRVVELSKFEKRRSSMSGSQAFVFAFCYPKEGPILVKGMQEEVDKYIHTKLSACHYHRVAFCAGVKYSSWFCNVDKFYISKERIGDRKGVRITDYRNAGMLTRTLRKLPLRFLKELEGATVGKSIYGR